MAKTKKEEKKKVKKDVVFHLFVAAAPVDVGRGIAAGLAAQTGDGALLGRDARLAVDDARRRSRTLGGLRGRRRRRRRRRRRSGDAGRGVGVDGRHAGASAAVVAALGPLLAVGVRAALVLAVDGLVDARHLRDRYLKRGNAASPLSFATDSLHLVWQRWNHRPIL